MTRRCNADAAKALVSYKCLSIKCPFLSMLMNDMNGRLYWKEARHSFPKVIRGFVRAGLMGSSDPMYIFLELIIGIRVSEMKEG